MKLLPKTIASETCYECQFHGGGSSGEADAEGSEIFNNVCLYEFALGCGKYPPRPQLCKDLKLKEQEAQHD